MWPMTSSNFFWRTIVSLDDPQKFSYWSDVAFYICNYDVIKKKSTLIPNEEYVLCAKFKFFPWCGFRNTEVHIFSVFPTWLPHHVTYNVIIILKTFHLRSRTDGENFLSIRQAVAKKNTKVLCGQTNRRTDPNAIPSPLVKVKMLHLQHLSMDRHCTNKTIKALI